MDLFFLFIPVALVAAGYLSPGLGARKLPLLDEELAECEWCSKAA